MKLIAQVMLIVMSCWALMGFVYFTYAGVKETKKNKKESGMGE